MLALAACSSTKRVGVTIDPVRMPSWARDGRHPDYPSDGYIEAVAGGETPEQARANANALLEVRIAAHALTLGANVLSNTRFAQIVREPAAWISISEFGGAIRRDAASDGFEHVALAAISKDELRLRAPPLLNDAKSGMPSEIEPPEIDDIVKRVGAWSERFVAAARIVALSLLSGSLDRAAFAIAERACIELHECADRMEVTQAGSGQVARVMGGVPNELQMNARFRGRYPTGMKLFWQVEAPALGVVSGFSEFNLTGHASCRLLRISSDGQEVAEVTCRPDLDAMAGRRLGIAAKRWTWLVTVPARKNVLLDMAVQEQVGNLAAPAEFTGACITWARLNDLALADDVAPREHARFKYRLAIEGKIEVSLHKQRGMLVAHATGQVVLRDSAANAVLFRFMPSVVMEVEEGADAGALALEAQREAAGDVLLEFGARIVALFPAVDERR